MTAIGIDFGTTNSVAALATAQGTRVIRIDTPPHEWADLGFDRVLPSVVNVGPDRQLSFGWAAKTATEGDKFEAIKRLFAAEEISTVGDNEFFVEEIAAAIFRHIRQRVISEGTDFSSAMITVPANSRGLARYRTRVCAGLGGIEPLGLINEPTAAAMAYSRRQIADDQTILVFDFGGGTLDCTLLETRDGMFFEQASKGIGRLGGVDFDNAILSAVAGETAGSETWSRSDKNRLKTAIEMAKIRLSDSDLGETTIVVPDVLSGYRLTRPRFDEITRPLVERSRTVIEKVLGELRMKGSDIDVLLLVGGTSKVPAVRQFVSELLGVAPATGVDPMTAIAEGAAIAAAIQTGELQDNDFFVSTEHALGTVTLDPIARALRFSPVIPRNQKLPAKTTETFYPVTDHQESVLITVIEGDPDKPLAHEENQILTEFEVPFDPPRPMSEAGFDLTFSYDTDGLLHVDVVDAMSGKEMSERVTVSFKGAAGGAELVGMANRVRTMVDTGTAAVGPTSDASLDRRDPRSLDLATKANSKVIPFLEPDDSAQIRQLVETMNTAGDSELPAAQDALEAALRKYSYLL